MKDQGQQPPDPSGNPNARNTGGTPSGGKDQAQQPAAPNPSLYNFGGLGPQVAPNPSDNAQMTGATFGQQGFSGVATQPGNTQAGQIAAQAPAANGAGNASPGGGNPGGVNPGGFMDTAGTLPPGANGAAGLGNGVPPLVGGDALAKAMKDAQDAAYKNATGYLDPQFANSQHDLEAKLANQGIPQGSEAWNRAMDEFNRGKTFAYGQAENNAVQQGNAAHGQLFNEGLAANANQFGQNMQGARFSEEQRQHLVQEGFTKEQIDNLEAQHRFDNSMSMRNQDINELLLQQQNPLQMYLAMLGGNGGVTPPQFTNTPGAGVNPTDILQSIMQGYNGQLNAYNANTGNANASNAAMASIIAALICDRRLKTNIRMIGMHVVGVPLYEFEYLWGEKGVGVMADELETVMPEAIIHVAGYKAVDYARL